MIKNLFLLALLFLVLAGCHVPVQQVKPLVEEEGETYLYVRPFPQGAEKLRFAPEAVSAVRGDGIEIPLDLRLAEFTGSEMTRQRLVAAKPLPPGMYTGFSLVVKNAFLKGEEGESALLLPKEPLRIVFPFEVKKGKGLLVSLAFNYDKSLTGVRFTPAFSASIPGRPLPALTGYATNYGANTITVFDKHAGEAMDVIQTGRGPAGIVIDQKQRTKAYVVLSGDDAIDVIDIATSAVINRIRLSPGDAPRDLALTPDGSTLITANTASNTVSFIDPLALVETARINLVMNRPNSVMIDRSGRRAYVFNTLSNNITVLDIPNRAVAVTFSTDTTPLRGDFSRKGDRFFVFHEWSPYLLVFDTVSLSQVKRIYDEVGIGWVKVDTNTDKIYVGKKQETNVEIYDPFSLIPNDSVTAAAGVSFMTIDGEENNLYLILPGKRSVQIINLVSKKVTGEIDLGDDPYWLTMMGER